MPAQIIQLSAGLVGFAAFERSDRAAQAFKVGLEFPFAGFSGTAPSGRVVVVGPSLFFAAAKLAGDSRPF